MTSTQRISSIADSYGIYTYKDDLIWFMIENHDDWRHREIALRSDPFIKSYVKRLDEEIWTEKPITEPDIFGTDATHEKNLIELKNGKDTFYEDKETNTISIAGEAEETDEENLEEDSFGQDITKEWEFENWNGLMIKMFDKSRIHSFGVVQLYDASPFWRVFCEREIKNIEYDDDDQPIAVDVEWSRALPYSKQYLNFKEHIRLYTPESDIFELEDEGSFGLLVPFGTPESEDKLGEFDLEDKWTLAVRIRYALLDIANNSSKTSGFYHYVWGRLITPTQETALKNAFDMASSSQGVGAKEDVLQEIRPIFPSKPEFTIDALAEFIREYAMACRLPLKFFRSEGEKGSLFGDQSGDDIAINKKKMYIFGKFKKSIMTLIFMRWAIKLEDIKPYIYESEEEEIDIPLYDNNQNKFQQPNKKEELTQNAKLQ